MSHVATEVAMVCVGPSLPVVVIFVASIVDGGSSIVLDGPSGLLPGMWNQRLYAPFQHLGGLDRFHGPTAEASDENGSQLVSSITEKS